MSQILYLFKEPDHLCSAKVERYTPRSFLQTTDKTAGSVKRKRDSVTSFNRKVQAEREKSVIF
jgi:hypothetical protein